MSLTDMTFLLGFLPISLIVYYIAGRKAREAVLLIISLLFYAIGSMRYIAVLLIAVLLTVIIARMISRFPDDSWGRKWLLITGIALNACTLAFFKFEKDILPLGISFFTFKAISYLTDVYKHKAKLEENPIHDVLYLTFFAQIQSGPLSRYNDMMRNVQKRFDRNLFSDGACRFLIGFSKKVLIADVLSNITAEIFGTPFDALSTPYAWLGSVCYSLQLFFDFSGYSDMAIGITELFGYKCPENFIFPYMTESVAGFWRRWHITLSEWFRDYVYIPLGGSRNTSKWRIYFNLLVVWLLTGIWHGRGSNYIAWGLGYLVVISLEKAFDLPGRLGSNPGKIIYRILSLLFINFQWVIFRSVDFVSGLRYIKRMILPCAHEVASMRTLFLIKDYWFFILVAIVLSTPVVSRIGDALKDRRMYTIYEVLISLIVIGAFIWSVSFVVAGMNNPFAYANF